MKIILVGFDGIYRVEIESKCVHESRENSVTLCTRKMWERGDSHNSTEQFQTQVE